MARKKRTPTTARSYGNLVTRYRNAKGLNQAELAEAVGVSKSTISAIEMGRASHAGTKEKIAKALGVSPYALQAPASATEMIATLITSSELLGIIPSEDGSCLVIDPEAEQAPKIALALQAWARMRNALADGSITEQQYNEFIAQFNYPLNPEPAERPENRGR